MSERMDSFGSLKGAYVHVPFCAAICPYCDFAVVAGREDLAARYIAGVITEIGSDEPSAPLDAVYFGGGTPSLVDSDLLGSVLGALESRHGIAPGAEVTLEANPEDWHAAKAAALRAIGFTRVSFGAQSFDPAVLRYLGRRHDADQIALAVEAARIEGFEEVSLDLIYGSPGESDASWRNTVSTAAESRPDHVSCYALTVEPGTELARTVREGAAEPDPDVQADRFAIADEVLTSGGLGRYEVSNWAVPGSECRYNSLVWAQGEYVAYGNGAHRFRNGTRSRNLRRLDGYLAAIESGGSAVAGEEVLGDWEMEIDRLFVGLRRRAGVAVGPGVDAFLSDPDGANLLAAGVVGRSNERLWVEDPMLTDAVLRAVVALEDGKEHLIADTLRITNA